MTAVYSGKILPIVWKSADIMFRNGAENPNGNFDINSLTETYGYLWKNTFNIIKKYPLAGSGPDNLAYSQLFQSLVIAANPNTFDRCGSYYLQTAGTLGIPMLLLFLALIVLVAGARRNSRQKKKTTGFILPFS